MQNLVRKVCKLAPFYFRATAPLFFALAPLRRAPPFSVRASYVVAQVPSTEKKDCMLNISNKFLSDNMEENLVFFKKELYEDEDKQPVWASAENKDETNRYLLDIDRLFKNFNNAFTFLN